MKFSTISLATAASAAAINKRSVPFEVRDFVASCIPHSAMCYYSLNLFEPGTMDTVGYNCSASAPGAGVAILPEITKGSCPPSSRTFDIVRSEAGLTVIGSVQVSRLSYKRGWHLIPNEQIQTIKGVTPTGDVQAYVGPKDFPLEYFEE